MPRSLIIRCDRCGDVVSETDHRPLTFHSGKLPRRVGDYDLCEPCVKAFRAWLGDGATPPDRGEDEVF